MLKKIRVKIDTTRHEVRGTLFEENTPAPIAIDSTPQRLSVTAEGSYYDNGDRITISYRESELSGMEGTRTTLAFHKSEPDLLTLTRDGTVRNTLVFEKGQCHVSLYQTPYMPFEVAVQTERVENHLEEKGTLLLYYTVELRGATATKTEFTLTVLPDTKAPMGLA